MFNTSTYKLIKISINIFNILISKKIFFELKKKNNNIVIFKRTSHPHIVLPPS